MSANGTVIDAETIPETPDTTGGAFAKLGERIAELEKAVKELTVFKEQIEVAAKIAQFQQLEQARQQLAEDPAIKAMLAQQQQ